MRGSSFQEFIPKSYFYLRKGYSFSTFKKDFVAGLTVGIIALPLAMALAIASGVTPERGLYTAIIAGFLVSALGGSRIQIAGPTGAFVVIVYGIVQRTGYNGLCISMLIAAIILILLGILRIGSWIRFVPTPLITGFTTGIAVLIFSTQVKDFFGLQMGTPPADFVEKWTAYFKGCCTLNIASFSLAAGTLAAILLIRRFIPRIPWGIASIVLATSLYLLFNLPVETIQSRFGEVPKNLPAPSFPTFLIPVEHYKEILIDGLTIAFLGSIESLLSAVIGDGMIGGKHRSNCELIAQGVANFGSVIFGGIPATGAIARTAANVKTGGQTPVAGMIHSITLLLILFFLAPLVGKIPLAALSAVLVMVSWDMSELRHFSRYLFKAPYGDRIVLIAAFLLTIFVDITVAICVGMILASFFFMQRMSQMSKAVPLPQIFQEAKVEFPERKDPDDISKKRVPSGVEVYEIQGPFFFGAANILREVLNNVATTPKVFILRMRLVPMIDASGMYGLEEFYAQCRKKGVTLLLSGVQGRTKDDLEKFGLVKAIKEENIFMHIDAALQRAETICK
jgi:SulP family sulfate permease